MTMLKKLWEGWKVVGRAIGDLLARVVLTLLYFTLVLPFGLISTLFRDPLNLSSRTPGWRSRETIEGTLDEAGKLS
jgi:hypothetical protein